jgi:hypothetical protein
MTLNFSDVIFQSMPSLRLTKNLTHTLLVLEEPRIKLLGQEFYNQQWIKKIYSKADLQRFAKNPIVCSGSVIGGQPAMSTYTSAMMYQADTHSSTLVWGVDQGHHNFLIHSRILEGKNHVNTIIRFEQGTGIVNTIGNLVRHGGNMTNLLTFNESSSMPIVLNSDLSISPIVHQHNRHKLLLAVYHENVTKQYMLEWETKQQQ